MDTTIIILIIIVLSTLSSIILSKISGYIIVATLNQIFKTFETSRQIVYYDTKDEWCSKLRDNYVIIKQEYKDYIKSNKLRRFKEIDNVQNNYDISDIPWEVLFLRAYNKDTNKIKYFPKTYEMISKIPGCTLAMFSVLHGGKVIPPHHGPYKGVLRYHLALITPKDESKCRIVVNKIPYSWREGQDVMFDDTFEHWVRNDTQETRVVLFLDIKKKFNNIFLDGLNSYALKLSKYNETVKEIVNNTNHDNTLD